MLEVNRNIEFLETISQGHRGICFDETYKSYLTNKKVVTALSTITKKMGKKIDLLGLDACLMAMVEFGLLVNPYCDLMVASQEVELGWGWNYATALSRFLHEPLTAENFAKEIVLSYQQAYKDITPDYTLSACHLKKLNPVNDNISNIAQLLMECMALQLNNSARTVIQYCRSRKQCTSFEEPSYVDIGHFYKNLSEHCNKIQLPEDKQFVLSQLKQQLSEGLQLINQSVFAKANGKNLAKATGLSIYFPLPTKQIHSSYLHSTFAKNNDWIKFLHRYLEK